MNHTSVLITHFAILCIAISMTGSEGTSSPIGFTVDLIHIDPPLLPSQRPLNALRRSFSRALRFKPNNKAKLPSPDIIGGSGDYVLEYSIGSPPVPSLGTADTGSDLIWTQCSPCSQCFNQTLPLFKPNKSSTYRNVTCNSTTCHNLSKINTCSITDKSCSFSQVYGDQSFSDGVIATDTITLGSKQGKTVSFKDVAFGCGHSNGGIFTSGESGVVGLGGGKGSLVSQLGPSIVHKFSYCLILHTSQAGKSSKLNFGKNAEVSGSGVVSTPIVPKKPKTFYYLRLEGVSVGNVTLKNSDKSDGEGNIIIDSGTTLTFLSPRLYTKVENVVRSLVELERVLDPEEIFNLCFSTYSDDIWLPDFVIHFRGADVKLKQENAFFRTSNYSVCLAFGAADYVPIYAFPQQFVKLIEDIPTIPTSVATIVERHTNSTGSPEPDHGNVI
ncbi:hypothetical protein ACS0TY_019817 [Phlomoides rotata]